MSKVKSVSKPGGDIELTDDELGKVAGGAMINFDGVEGESTHKDHSGYIELGSTPSGTLSPTPRTLKR